MIRILLLIGLLLAGGGCHQQTVRSGDFFQVGEHYRVAVPLLAVKRGSRISLLPPDRVALKDAEAFARIESGTLLEVIAIREDNTLTHGMDRWPEAIVRSGSHQGLAVSLGYTELKEMLDRTSTATGKR